MHRLDSCADLKHMLESGAGDDHRLNTTYLTRQVKGVPQGANYGVGRSNLLKHLLRGIRNSENPERAIPRAKRMTIELA